MNKYVNCVYLPNPLSEQGKSFLSHFCAFKRHYDTLVLTDSECSEHEFHQAFPPDYSENILILQRIPTIGPYAHRPGDLPLSDQYAFWAFVWTIQVVDFLGYTHFILSEIDCRYTTDNWDQIMTNEFALYPNALFGGTPVCWHPWSVNSDFSKGFINLAYEYQERSGVHMAFEGGYSGAFGTAFYPNGALAIYSVAELKGYFSTYLSMTRNWPVPIALQQVACKAAVAFDLYIGTQFVQKHGLSIFTKFAPIPQVYSGCKDHHITLSQRIEMLRKKKKVAIHHLKEVELSYTDLNKLLQ